ncbi:MAG: hypothetical protein ACTSUE_23210 [Promethearchaeota archaeon]
MTQELHPVTSKILDKASSVIKTYYRDWDEDKVRNLVFKAVREEEIKIQKLLYHFCELPIDQRRKVWLGIFKHLVDFVPDKKIYKKIFKDCRKNMEACMTESCEPEGKAK